MKRCKIGLTMCLATILLMLTTVPSLIAQNTMDATITGIVKSPLEIVDSKGVVYFLEFEEDSDDFDDKLIGKKIKITGLLIEENNEKTIYAKSYVVLK